MVTLHALPTHRGRIPCRWRSNKWRKDMGVFRNRLFVPALLAGLAAAGPAIAQSGQSLMEERQGAIGNTQQPNQGDAPKPAVQGDNTAGTGAASAEDQARAATGAAPPPGSLQFGGTGTGTEAGAPLIE